MKIALDALKKFLRLQGAPLPENDIWIAASSMEHGPMLLTRDSHFACLPQLRVRWTQTEVEPLRSLVGCLAFDDDVRIRLGI